MSNSLFVTSTEPYSGKSAVTLGLMDLLVRNARDVAFFRPVIADSPEKDRDINLILTQFNLNMKPEEAYACTLTEARELINARKRDELMIKILQKFKALCRTHDFVLCEGTDYEAPEIASEANFNLKIADALDSPLALLSSGLRRSLDAIRQSTLSTLDMLSTRQQELACIFVNRAHLNEAEVHGLQEELSAHAGGAPVYVIQENSVLSKPSIRDVKNALNAEILAGGEYLDTVAEDYIIAAMQIGNFLNYITPGTLVITPSDRVDIILASLGAKASKSCPEISGILLTGGLPLAPTIMNLTRGLQNMPMPILLAKDHTYKTIMDLTALHTTIRSDDKLKIDAALSEFARNVDGPALLDRILNRKSTRMTPLMFEFSLFEQARKHKMRIVLPEACEERILRAAEILLDRDVVELILIGDKEAVRSKIDRMGLRLDNVTIINPESFPLFDNYVQAYYEMRKAKGMTPEKARERMLDPSYFGTMMVKMDAADGMVSGAVHTTAHTIRPSFEFIKTKPGFENISSVFFMCMRDRVLVFADCAVIPNPTPQQLAEIAVSSAHTARTFGIKPRVAMLSYSTGDSGKGPDVDLVIEATRLAREKAPEIPIEGPLQYDAAIAPDVARTKLPGSEIAGRATVFIFPDLNTGNTTYKAVQRSAEITAIGPVLQGLNKPVNDLSRGCLVEDIVNTVVITAIQAQAEKGLI